MPEVPHRSLTRRAMLAAAAGAVAAAGGVTLAGCRPFGGDTDPDGTTAAAPSDGGAAPDADADLVDDAVRALSSAHDLVRRTLRKHADLGRDLGPFVALHERHVADLDADLVAPTRHPRIAPDRRGARSAVLDAEARLRATLETAAAGAASGVLAASLASMSAAVAQQQTRLGVRP